jgi:hypothetical protein
MWIPTTSLLTPKRPKGYSEKEKLTSLTSGLPHITLLSRDESRPPFAHLLDRHDDARDLGWRLKRGDQGRQRANTLQRVPPSFSRRLL